jgi:hypothetical protein
MAKPLLKFECCICGDTVESEYGNIPWPFRGDRCCELCGDLCVIPVRELMAAVLTDVREPTTTVEERTKLRTDAAREREERVKRRGPWTPGVIQGGVQ